MKDFLRAGAATPTIRVADADYNCEEIVRAVESADRAGIKLLVLPELCLTGYTCGDLFLQDALLCGAEAALLSLRDRTRECNVTFCTGLPFRFGGKLYNVAAVVSGGKILGFVPKRNVPNYGEFYEGRHFAGYDGENVPIDFGGERVLFGNRIVFRNLDNPDFTFGVEICEDLWVAETPSAKLCANGAKIILNLSASDETVSKSAYRRQLVSMASAKMLCAYLYADAGEGESTTDLVFAGHNLVCENGALLAETPPFGHGTAAADLDLERIAFERRRMNTFGAEDGFEAVGFSQNAETTTLDALFRPIDPLPFLPKGEASVSETCEEILNIQSMGLKKRMAAARAETLVVGISGGLDSCLALLVASRAADRAGWDRTKITAISMPCFGTTPRTKNNAKKLCAALGVGFREINIRRSVTSHLSDLGHSIEDHSVVFENAQARERTQVLMDVANGSNGLVVGTGDLSELALGWATYNGDHMSNYGVNAGVPKTLVRFLVRNFAEHPSEFAENSESKRALSAVLLDILGTPVSPELLPATDGEISQRTEDLVGPYELHDFFLFHIVRYGSRPEKVFLLARIAFPETDPEIVKKWLKIFVRRFFAQQFKRSCLPDGPKVGSVSLSPRGDFRMPSDACADLWLRELETL